MTTTTSTLKSERAPRQPAAALKRSAEKMSEKKSRSDAAAAAAKPLALYAAFSAIGALATCFLYATEGPSSGVGLLFPITYTVMTIVFGVLSIAVRRRKNWAWIPSVILSCLLLVAFPIGTLISIWALKSLSALRKEQVLTTDRAEQGSDGKPDTVVS